MSDHHDDDGDPPPVIYSVGHSVRSIEEFIELLKHYGVEILVDVRHYPRSRRNPQFNKEALPSELEPFSIRYVHLEGLGGLRKPTKDSINSALRSASFRGYADYMQSDEFKKSLEDLLSLAKRSGVAIMCAEAVPWRCHRFLLSDALVARGFDVEHIISQKSVRKHKLSSLAKVENSKVTYPSPKQTTTLLQGNFTT